MGTRDQRVDEYIAKSADFAKPILTHLRKLVHKACPEAEEKMKWSFPHFDYKGMLCSMAGFKQHCSFGFWKAALMKDARKFSSEQAMGSMGRITSLKDLPSDSVLIRYVKEAAKLNERGAKLPSRSRKTSPKEFETPDYFIKAIQQNQEAYATFQNFSYSHRKEYVDWVAEAKTEETRNRRLATSVEWLAQGKSRHWKYEKK
jgi:uncharacterized protein YdeI (YjbR/CyaY-like superfamily)